MPSVQFIVAQFPANASWLNQAEILIHAFKHYYLQRASWTSQEEFKIHVQASWPEYNHRYAHPFEWTWTNQKMRQWFAKHAANSLDFIRNKVFVRFSAAALGSRLARCAIHRLLP